MTEQGIIAEILEREGDEFTNHPHDRGGPTKYGITQRSWNAYRSVHNMAAQALTPANVRDLKRRHAVDFYLSQYVKPFGWIIDSSLRVLVIDAAVNHGASRAVKWMQQAAGVVVDGRVGPITQRAVNVTPHAVYRDFLVRRIKYYAEIATDEIDRHEPQDPDAVFLRGWMNRVTQFVR